MSVVEEEQAAPETRLVARLAELGVRVEELRETEGWVSWLRTARRFHRYSFGNQLLIAFQRPEATRVAGYRAWQEMGRQVVKGEKGIAILRPRLGRKDEAGNRPVIGFGTATVFDVGQTIGEPVPEPPPWPFAGGTPMLLFEDLVQQVAAATGLDVYDPEHCDGPVGARGWYTPTEHTIAVRAEIVDVETGEIVGVPPAQRVKTLLHELGHHFDPEAFTGARADAELVAESVAWITGTELGLELDATVEHYLASWDATPEGLVFLGRRITRAVQSIESMLGTAVDVPAEVAA